MLKLDCEHSKPVKLIKLKAHTLSLLSLWKEFYGNFVYACVCVCVCVRVGVVYNYTRGGVCRDQSGWERCVSVPLVRPDMFHLLAQWDQYLNRFSEGPMWDPAWHRYTLHITQVLHTHGTGTSTLSQVHLTSGTGTPQT